MRRLERIVKQTWGQKGTDWLSTLPSTIKQLCKHWSLSHISHVDNLSYHYVAYAKQNDMPVILKIGCDIKSIESEYKTLKHFNGQNSIQAIDLNEELGALLLEQAIPGLPLKNDTEKNMKEKINIYTDIVKSIETRPNSNNNYPHASNWCEAIDRIKSKKIKSELVEKAKVLKSSLLSSVEEEHLCHGDLHLENILQQGESWLCIDPKGVIGETAFEAATFNLLSKEEREAGKNIRALLLNRITLLSNALNINTERLLS